MNFNLIPEHTRGAIEVVNYTSILTPKNVHDHDCSMFHGCDNWTKNNFIEISSTYAPFELPPVMDQRWNCID
jgi:hypothetical protein